MAYPPKLVSLSLAETLDEDLVVASRDRDHCAFEELYRRYRRPVRDLCFRLVGDPARADDLTQETFTRAYAHMERFRDGHRFYSWIAAIARNLCVDELRASPRTKPTAIDGDENLESLLPHDPSDVSDHVIRRHETAGLRARLVAALGALSPRERRILWLKHAEGWSYEEIARADGSSVGATRNAAFRARGAARVLLEREGAPALGLMPAIVFALRALAARTRSTVASMTQRLRPSGAETALGERAMAAFMAVAVVSTIWVADNMHVRSAHASEMDAVAARHASATTHGHATDDVVSGSSRVQDEAEEAAHTTLQASTEAMDASVDLTHNKDAAAPRRSHMEFKVEANGMTVYEQETFYECGDAEDDGTTLVPESSPVKTYC